MASDRTPSASPATEKMDLQPHKHAHADDGCGCGHDHHHHHASVVTFTRGGPKIGRNDVCPCGSNKKYKKCCLAA